VRRLIIIVLVGVLSLAAAPIQQAEQYNTNAKMKAMFVYNFTKYIEWPQDYKAGNFVIGVLGDSPLLNELNRMAATKKVVNQTIEVKQYNSIDDIQKCHMLFVSKEQTGKIVQAKTKVTTFSTLIITEVEGLAKKGSGINFVIRDNKQRFELNKRTIEKHKLKVSSNLLALAIVVEGADSD